MMMRRKKKKLIFRAINIQYNLSIDSFNYCLYITDENIIIEIKEKY